MIQFYLETPNVADWISLFLTIGGLYLAYKAYGQWKKEKEYDVILDALIKSQRAIVFLRFHNVSIALKEADAVMDDTFPQKFRALRMHRDHVQKELDRFEGIVDETYLIYEKLRFNSYKSSPLFVLYDKILRHMTQIKLSEANMTSEIAKIMLDEIQPSYDQDNTSNRLSEIYSKAYLIDEEDIQELENLQKKADESERKRWAPRKFF